MSEGELSSNGTGSEDNTGKEQTGEASKGGRFRAPMSGGIELPAYAPEEDEAVGEVAKRFRSGPRLGSPVIDQGPSLDQIADDDDGGDVDAGFLLDALDTPQFEPAKRGLATGATVDSIPIGEEMTEAGGPDPNRDEEELPMVEVEPVGADPSEAVSERSVVCPSCNAENPEGMSFCVECGGSLKRPKRTTSVPSGGTVLKEERPAPPPATAAAEEANPWDIQLVSINEDGSDGTKIALKFLETTVGRDGDQRFPTDAFLSPKHSRFHIENGKLFIEDLYSLNGTFIKLRDETRLTPGDTILMGRQVLRFERFEQSITPKTKSSDGTRYMGSPAPGGSFKILQIGIGGVVQNVYCLPEAGAVLGREKGDIVFPHDKFMSGRHAQIYAGDDGHCYLVDLNSSNGTWVKIWEKTRLENGDFIFMGQQLFRVRYGG